MNKLKASVLAAAVLFGVAVTADAFAQRSGRGGGGGGRGHYAQGGHHHGGHYHHGWGWGVGLAVTSPFWYGYGWPYYAPYYRPYYGYPAYGYPAVAGVPEYAAGPATYVEQGQAAPGAGYWYYCNESQAYYPYVQQCAGPWQRVAPQPPPS